MPKLSDLVDTEYLPAQEPKRVYIYGKDSPDDTVEQPSPTSSKIDKILNSLFRNDDKRYQLWPEKVIREGLTAAGDAMSGGSLPSGLRREDFTDILPPMAGTKADIPGIFSGLAQKIGITPVAWSPADKAIEKAQAISALAGTGGLGGVTDATLGATPFLRPALKYKDRLYKGKEGQGHQDVIPDALYPEFQKMAMSGEDISHYNFGFVNDKGHFLNREDALKYGIDTGLIDPQAGKFGALTSTLMADSSKLGTAIEAMAKVEPFYSALEHNVSKIPQDKMNGEQWLGTLSNKPGVKPEEMQWTGLQDFLLENKGKSVTKAQIEEHLNNNKIELKEVMKGKQNNNFDSLTEAEQNWIVDDWSFNHANQTPRHLGVVRDWYNELQPSFKESETKYHSYQLPGGENYREMLLTLPKKSEEGLKSWNKITADSQNYKSSHWDEPNILAHVRMNDRIIDGKKSLHLEEIQSDWHQQGRDSGYKDPNLSINDKALEIAKREGYKSLDDVPARTRSEFLEDAREWVNNKGGVPDAPFKKSWHELALKRMIREAAEKGYDRLSWTPGEAQAARYDLSKSVNTVVYKDGKLTAIGNNGEHVINNQIMGKDKLADFIGKEAAEKLLKQEPHNGAHTLQGEQLKIGGEGMKGFYDQIIPKSLEKLGKEHRVKVKQGALPNDLIRKTVDDRYSVVGDRRTFDTKAEAEAAAKKNLVHYIDIPQSMRDAAMSKGFPLFSSSHAGFTFTPVSHDPFEEKKK